MIVFGDDEPKCSKCYACKARIAVIIKEGNRGKTPNARAPSKNGLTSLFTEVRVFEEVASVLLVAPVKDHATAIFRGPQTAYETKRERTAVAAIQLQM